MRAGVRLSLVAHLRRSFRLEEPMPGLGGRIETLTKAKISHLFDRAEDPAETLDYAYEQQVEDLQNVKKGIVDVVTAKKRLQLLALQLGPQSASLTVGLARRCPRVGRIWLGPRSSASS